MIRLEVVTFGYDPRHPVLKDLDLEVREGEFFMLVGPSGSGKSTVLNLVAGFLHPTRGEIRVEGEPVGGPGPERLVVFQGDDSLLDWRTARENVAFGLEIMGWEREAIHDATAKYLEMVGLAEHGSKYPHELSGGMKKRIQIARALVPGSPILLMDEPFGALDAQTRSVLQGQLAAIAQKDKRTILFITHDVTEAVLLGDRVGILSKGPEARLKKVLPIDLPRPRRWGDPAFGEIHDYLRNLLFEEVNV